MKKYITSHLNGIACTILILALAWGVAGIKDEPRKQTFDRGTATVTDEFYDRMDSIMNSENSQPMTVEQYGKLMAEFKAENERLNRENARLWDKLRSMQ